MGAMTFVLPNAMAAGMARELERACIAGGPDNMPWPTQARVENGRLIARRDVDESGALVAPWTVIGAGRVMSSSATLIEQEAPYWFRTELARGKVHQLRSQAAEWQAGGLDVPTSLSGRIHACGLRFADAVTMPPESGNDEAQNVLDMSYRAADELVRLYVEKMFEVRQSKQPKLDATLGCRLGGGGLTKEQNEALLGAFNTVSLALTWGEVEPSESTYCWEPYDKLLQWAQTRSVNVTGGPLIDFSTARLPDWLWLWERDLQSIASFMCDYVETAIKRYAKSITSWELCAASNCGAVLGLSEDELLWLTARLVEAARQADPKLDLSVGIAQPWGEYMAVEDRTHSPYIFADTLIRSGLPITAIDVELWMGVLPRGSYCRDLLDTSRLIDLYSLMGVPLRIQMAYPSDTGGDDAADQELKATGGHIEGGLNPATQASWAETIGALALCKPSVRGIQWSHWSDASPHQVPHGGLWSAQGKAKPALDRLQQLRQKYLR
jgi:hypothetical protein